MYKGATEGRIWATKGAVTPNRNSNPRRGDPMTKIDWNKFKPIPGFDSLKWKQEVQAKIYEETKHMTPEQ